MHKKDNPRIKKTDLLKLIKIKNKMAYSNKNFSKIIDDVFKETENKKTVIQTIDEIYQRKAYERYYDDWIRNFALNLEHIWNDHSASELIPKNISLPFAIIIGRGPSLYKNRHLEMLANSNYDGIIICSDGALINTLKSGVTPDKFKNFFVVTIDTNTHVRDFYNDPIIRKYGNKIKCILSTTIPLTTYNIIKKSNMQIFWIHALFDYDKGKTSFNYISGMMVRSKNHSNGLSAIQTGGNVGTSAWVLAWSIFKCSKVVLLGIDHGYHIETSWDEINKYHKIPSDTDFNSKSFKKAYPIIYNPEFDCYCRQDPIFQYYSQALKKFILKKSGEVETINATQGGAIFGKGIHCASFQDFLKKHDFLD